MFRKSYRVVFPFIWAGIFLGLWTIAARADGGYSAAVQDFSASGMSLPEGSYAGTCDEWTQVNDGAFGVSSTAHTGASGDYFSEDGFEVAVHNGHLYVGMEADDVYGAQLWRSKSGVSIAVTQTNWEEVAQVGGLPFGNGNAMMDEFGVLKFQNDHIDSLASFNGVLYASTANGGNTTQGTLVYSSTTGDSGTWAPVIEAGFGFTENENLKDMQVFQGWLCGGTNNSETGAQVWCTQDGGTWLQKNFGGFGRSADNPDTIEVWSGHVYADALYFGTQQATLTPNVYRGVLYKTENIESTSPLWTPVYTSPSNGYRIDILGELDNFLYISHRDPVNGAVILRSENGATGTWTSVNIAGMDNNSDNTGTVVDGATVYNGMLYCALTNTVDGTEVWRTDGVSQTGMLQWTQVGSSGLGDNHNRTAELIPWNGYLYAWTSNYLSGQEVRRTSCSVCQAKAIDGPGHYDFPVVGTSLTLTVASLDVVTVCIKPNLLPVYPQGGIVLSRTIELSVAPQGGNFVADLAFAYEPQELNPTAANSPTLYLRFWEGDSWATVCQSEHNSTTHTILCRDLTRDVSLWVSSIPGVPTMVRLSVFHTETAGLVVGVVGFACVVIAIVLIGYCRGRHGVSFRFLNFP